ncbi:MAG: GNAT family N-acetyltransferase [Promethearchaeota archaeon]
MPWEIREYKDEDEDQVLELIKLAYGLTDHREFWRWMVKTNPSGHAKIYLVYEGNNIIGNYMIVPRRRKILDDIVMDGEAVWAAVHPNYRKKGIFTELGIYSLADIRNEIPVCTGFPNIYAINGHLKAGWRFFDIPLLKLDINDKTNKKDSTLVHRGEFGEEFDDFWMKISKDYSNIVVRDASYLNYRYFHKPIDYEIRVIRDEEVLGFVVLKKYFDKSHIVDILAKDDAILSELLAASINFAVNNKSKILSCIMMEDRFYYASLMSYGFDDIERKLFIYHINRENFKMPKEFFITMGDWDVF